MSVSVSAKIVQTTIQSIIRSQLERSSMASGSFVYENRTVWDVEDSWNLLTWQDFDDNGPQLPQAALAVDQGSSVTQSGQLPSPSNHPTYLKDSQRTLSPSNYSIPHPVALLSNDPGNNHNDASILCNSETLQEPRRHDDDDDPMYSQIQRAMMSPTEKGPHRKETFNSNARFLTNATPSAQVVDRDWPVSSTQII
ncbi:uncharacterized protein C8R40DRAFT_1167749 [Lentinula edodes]|uniref:uncharacterized protein n=1 Tax=Lentinula edodes TaxID=5353 RepID=UPI001E8D4A65|nr:uncharacterized protein C8R40DRAFT_1167749 [Lentinula edodes]KAH7878324.1 hypothetical protein C8R40DRAFT_1167749 [Lentinula edodes]KAJ3911546.1 hypothetical protein F5877DRAFT_85812 [Lentinula edodes]